MLASGKFDPKGYSVIVSGGPDTAHLIVLSYNIDRLRRLLGLEFYVTVSTFDSTDLSIPYGRQATFQEELRVTSQSADASETPRSGEIERIRERIREAYGEEIDIAVEEIGPPR